MTKTTLTSMATALADEATALLRDVRALPPGVEDGELAIRLRTARANVAGCRAEAERAAIVPMPGQPTDDGY